MRVTKPDASKVPILVKFPELSTLVVPHVCSEPSDKLRFATCETVELRRIRVLVAAPVMSKVVSPPDMLTVVSAMTRLPVPAASKEMFVFAVVVIPPFTSIDVVKVVERVLKVQPPVTVSAALI